MNSCRSHMAESEKKNKGKKEAAAMQNIQLPEVNKNKPTHPPTIQWIFYEVKKNVVLHEENQRWTWKPWRKSMQ